MALPEKSFEESVKDWLESEGIYALGTPKQKMITPPCGYWEKRWGGGKYIKGGMPDMHIVVRGVSIEAELKVPGNYPSALQKQKLRQIDEAGCIGLVLYPRDFENFKRMIRYIKETANPDPVVVTLCGMERGCKV